MHECLIKDMRFNIFHVYSFNILMTQQTCGLNDLPSHGWFSDSYLSCYRFAIAKNATQCSEKEQKLTDYAIMKS